MSIIVSKDGSHTLISERFGESYHSKHGAVTESAHVFISAGLLHKSAAQREISILETGFGSGLNAFMSWLAAEQHGLRVNYTGLELFPVSIEMAADLNYPDLLGCPERKADFLHLHSTAWDTRHIIAPCFELSKNLLDIQYFEADSVFDVIYFDAFAPQAQPELWTEDVFNRMFRALRPDGILVTYCAQGEFKRQLKKAGFMVERLPGPPGKREMTRATVPAY